MLFLYTVEFSKKNQQYYCVIRHSMIHQLHHLVNRLSVDSDGIYFGTPSVSASADQTVEISLRERIAVKNYDNYLYEISNSHSIPVMDHEVDRFLLNISHDALILDIGGCWGWHWRRLAETRRDVGVVIIDFVRSNLTHAKNVLGDLVGRQVLLIHADATALPFVLDEGFSGFDGVWTVQTFQHIPDFNKAVLEVYRVLKVQSGLFANYSLNVQPPVRWLYRLFGRSYITEGNVPGAFWLARASEEQKSFIEAVFGCKVSERWSEILFSPELHFNVPGRAGSKFGQLDSFLSNNTGLLRCLARQHSFHCRKQ